MKLNINFFKYKLLILFFLLMSPGFVFAAVNEKMIAVSSFKIESQEKLEFLEKGIAHMLETRLKIPGHSFVVFSPEGSAKADYILEGTILIFGDSVNTDAKLIKAESGEVELVFSQVGKEKGDVLKQIDLLAERIRTEVLHLAPSPGYAQAYAQGPESGQMAYIESKKPVIWRSGPLDTEITGIAVADIDNDSKNETLILSNDGIRVFRRTTNGFEKLSEISLPSRTRRNLFVDVIDLDNDGNKEIFITGIDDYTLRPDASLYRWNTSGLVKVVDGLNWILRAVDTKDKGRILLGQATKGDDSKRLETGIFRMEMDKAGRLSPAERVFPFADSLLGLAFGDFLNNGQETVAVLDLKGKLSIYSSEGMKLFTNPDEYGGSAAYIEFKGIRYTQPNGYLLDKIYLQQRIFAADFFENGKTSLVTVKNEDTLRGLLPNLRSYNKAHIESLLSNEMGMTPEGRTQTISGYIPDYTIADMDNDGKKEIIFANVNSDGLLKKKTSRILSQSFIVRGMAQPF